jgi:hypothetical protein
MRHHSNDFVSGTISGALPRLALAHPRQDRSLDDDDTYPYQGQRHSGCLCGQLRCDLRYMLALEASRSEFIVAWPSLALTPSDRGGAIRRSAGELVHASLPLKRVGQADDDHTMVKQRGVEAQYGRLLAAMLGGSTCKNAPDLSNQLALGPKTTGSVEELSHLTCHVAKPGWRAKDDGVGFGEIADVSDGYISKGFLRICCTHGFNDIGAQRFRNALDEHVCALYLFRACGDRLGEAIDMAIGRIEQHE